MVRLEWQPVGAERKGEMFQVLRATESGISEIADYTSIGPAIKTAKRFAASSQEPPSGA